MVVIAALALVVMFAPIVPSSATAKQSNGTSTSHTCTVPGCILSGATVQGYGSVSYTLVERGAFYYQGNYVLTNSGNFTITVSA